MAGGRVPPVGTVIFMFLASITQNFVGFGYFLKFFLSIWFFVLVWMKLECHLFIRLLDVIFTGGFIHSQNFIIVLHHNAHCPRTVSTKRVDNSMTRCVIVYSPFNG